MAALLSAATVLGANPGITITNLRSDRGRLLWMLAEANGQSHQGMENPSSGAATIAIAGISSDSATLYAYHDENGNYALDRREDGMPAEGCCTYTIRRGELAEDVRLELRYEFGRKTRQEAPQQDAAAAHTTK